MPNNAHCYSDLVGSGTFFRGIAGTWNRAYMASGADGTNQNFVNSEMWAGTAGFQAWVEEGIHQGSFPNTTRTDYLAFWCEEATSGVGSYHCFPIAYLTQNDSVTDNYQISRSTTTNQFNVWFDGTAATTENMGFWSVNDLQEGAEVGTPVGHAHTFNMYGSAIDSSNNYVNWGTQSYFFVPAGGTILNGVNYHNSEWSWNTVQP